MITAERRLAELREKVIRDETAGLKSAQLISILSYMFFFVCSFL